MKAVGVLISGRGSNLQALLDAERAGRLAGTVAVVVSSSASAAGLERARRAGVPAVAVEPGGRRRETHDAAVIEVLREHRVDLVCLAGYMRILSSHFVTAFTGRILNVHPSLLPSFPGRNAVRQAWEHGVKVSGATVHFVDEGLDSGLIVLQEAVPVRDDDDPSALAARILAAEHRLYPRAVTGVLEGRFRIDGRRVSLGA